MNISAGKIFMKIAAQVTPAMIIDRGHQATQKRNSSHIPQATAPI